MIVAYHGTQPESCKSILMTGFHKGTWFAYDLGDAIKFGGPWVFAVPFPEEGFRNEPEGEAWQFHLRDSLPPDVILWARKYSFEEAFKRSSEEAEANIGRWRKQHAK